MAINSNSDKEARVRSVFGEPDFSRGKVYFKKGCVDWFLTEKTPNGTKFSCTVEGTYDYDVEGEWTEERLTASCNCMRFYDCGTCKHIVAGFLELISSGQIDETHQIAMKDDYVKEIIRYYLENAQQKSKQKADFQKLMLIPKIDFYNNNYPRFSFWIGESKYYKVHNITELLERIKYKNTYRYGKTPESEFDHSIICFDEKSQKIIDIINSIIMQNNYIADRYYCGGFSSDMVRDTITVVGDSFDKIINLFDGETIESATMKTCWRIKKGDPIILLNITKTENGASVSITGKEDMNFFGEENHFYARTKDTIYCCSNEFFENSTPLISEIPFTVFLSNKELPSFCGSVIPRIKEFVEISDDNNILLDNKPDDCNICYYFDTDKNDKICVKAIAKYGKFEFMCNTETEEQSLVKRNYETELNALIPIEKFFHKLRKSYVINDNVDAYDFYTDRINTFRSFGEVFVSQKMSNRKITVKNTKVGVSVSDGMLTLSIDMGNFPPEELEELYQSLLHKQKYYKLKDGRFLTLDGSPCETIAEMAHMLRLSSDDLKKEEIVLPAFRGLYLDSILSENKDIDTDRDKAYFKMLDNFKCFSENDIKPPEKLKDVLRPYQLIGYKWLKTLEAYGFGGILADEMGLGKTLQVITLLLSIKEKLKKQPALIVCPTSLILNWGDEISRFAQELSVKTVTGTSNVRAELIKNADCEVWITSYDLLKRDIENYTDKCFNCCVLDEGQYIKNFSTLSSKAVKSINCNWRIVLTGTPIENRLSELWNLFDFLMPGYLFSNHTFVEKIEKPIIKNGDVEANEHLTRLIKPFVLRRLKKDVLTELPDKINHIHRIALSATERKIYSAEAYNALNKINSKSNKIEILAILTRLRQLCCSPSLCLEKYKGETSKLDACIELCESMVENGHKLLIFSQFTSALDLIADRLDNLLISNFTLKGSTPAKERARLVNEFQNGETSVFLISLKAGGTGLNLTAADVVIHFDPWWNVAAQNQATDRTHRIGQKSHVHVYQLIANNTIEDKILDLQAKKSELADAIIGGNESGILNISRDELIALLRE